MIGVGFKKLARIPIPKLPPSYPPPPPPPSELLRKLCYSIIYVMMLLGYKIAGISQKLELERKNMPCVQMLHILIASVIHAWCKKKI